MNIDVIDNEDPAVGTDCETRLNDRGVSSTHVQMFGMSNGVGQMISDIKQVARVGGVNVLRIWSHAAPGSQNVSAGQEDQDVHWSGISTANIDAMQNTLATLTPYFSASARVELRGCEVAAGSDGEALLKRLARIWGVTVQGGIVDQDGIDWVGPVHQSDSGGNLSCTAGVNP